MLDLIIVLIIIGSGLLAAKIGFIRSVYQLVSSVIALLLAIVLQPIVSGILKITPVYTWIQANIDKMIPDTPAGLGVQGENYFIGEITQVFPRFITELIIRNNNSEVYQLLGVQDLKQYVVMTLANIVLAIIAICITWLIIKIVLATAIGVLDLVSRLPIIRTANQLAGFGVGVLKGLLFIWLIFSFLPVLVGVPQMSQYQGKIEESVVAHYLYENNLILQVISQMGLK